MMVSEGVHQYSHIKNYATFRRLSAPHRSLLLYSARSDLPFTPPRLTSYALKPLSGLQCDNLLLLQLSDQLYSTGHYTEVITAQNNVAHIESKIAYREIGSPRRQQRYYT